MAAASIIAPSHNQPSMSTRRVPLGNNTNAANSPYRGNVTAVGSKLKRSHASNESYGQPPPSKRRLSEQDVENARTPPRRPTATDALENAVFSRRAHAQPTAFDRKLEAARNETVRRRTPAPVAPRVTAQVVVEQTQRVAEKATEDNLETIRKWQRHYKKVFPQMVFYFESVPDDLRLEVVRQVMALGAREEMFFSNKVTHVITTRTIPPEGVSPARSSTTESTQNESRPQTINPSLLERAGSTHAEAIYKARHGLRKASQPPTTAADENKKPARSADVLVRAREIGMKIWALEKLKRMMATMFDPETGIQHNHNTRQASVQAVARPGRDVDLSTLLRAEKSSAPPPQPRELILFRGPYIYIRDLDEKQKPIMVREYAKPLTKETGDWPQFRSVSMGKCPFVPEADTSRRDAEREILREQRRIEKERQGATRTRSAAAAVQAAQRMQPPQRRALTATESANNSATISAEPSTYSATQDGEAQPNAYVKRAAAPARMFNGEPVASGIQNNITSAIHSQMVSSAAMAPGQKAGISKEVHALGRRVLEKNSVVPAQASRRMNDLSIRGEDAKRRKTAREESFNDENRGEQVRQKSQPRRSRRPEPRAPKAGYCENCMDKFDDFDEHILSRKHRRFAEKAENWAELDELLSQLGRPYRNGGRDMHSDL